VLGVRFVEDELTLDPRDHVQDEIRGADLEKPVSNMDIPVGWIDVKVDNGWLTLKGEVRHQYENDAAFEAVSDVPAWAG
jgi:osmotically-inducible protein OsmY